MRNGTWCDLFDRQGARMANKHVFRDVTSDKNIGFYQKLRIV